MDKQCIYCGEPMIGTASKEHVISKAVLQVPFGKDISNVTTSELFGDEFLPNHEQTIKDVCRKCNNSLSLYDVAGAELVRSLHNYYDLDQMRLAVSNKTIGWIIKTHLNFLRIIPYNPHFAHSP